MLKHNKFVTIIIFLIILFLGLPSKAKAQNTTFYVYDTPGRSITALIDNAENIVTTYEYDAFGNVTNNSPSNISTVKYVGEQQDIETGLIFLRNRYYEPIVGRFIAKDPLPGNKYCPQAKNPYPYCNNNPTGYIDPLGLAGIGWIVGASGEAGLGPTESCAVSESGGIIAIAGPENVGVGGFNSFGSFMGGDIKEYAAGACAGAGTGIVLTTAESFESFSGTGITKSFNLGLGLVGLSVQYTKGDSGAKTLGIFFLGPSLGLSTSSIETKTTQVNVKSNFISPIDMPIIPSNSYGGVSLSKTANLMLNIQDVGGAAFDEGTGQVILYGKENVTLPDMDLDDLSTAVRSVYGLNSPAEDPGVSIGTEPSDIPGRMKVRYDGETFNTEFGSVMFDSDRQLKCLTLGKDNITGQPVGSGVPGYKNMLDRYREAGGGSFPSGEFSDRMWFVPKEVKLVQSYDGTAMVFDRAIMQLLTESKFQNNVTGNPVAEAFASHFTGNYDAFADERPVLKELKRLGKITGVVKWIKDNNVPFDLSFFEDYVPQVSITPQYTPQTSVAASWTEGRIIHTFTRSQKDCSGLFLA